MEQDDKMEFIHRLGKVGKQWGLGESAGKIWGTLLLIGRPLTQREIAEHCGYSPGLVSRNLNVLSHLGIVHYSGRKVQEKLYKPTTSFIGTFEKLVLNFMESEVNPIIDLLGHIKNDEKDKEVRSRIEDLIGDYRKMRVFLDFFTKILEVREKMNLPNIENSTKETLNKLLKSMDSFGVNGRRDNFTTL